MGALRSAVGRYRVLDARNRSVGFGRGCLQLLPNKIQNAGLSTCPSHSLDHVDRPDKFRPIAKRMSSGRRAPRISHGGPGNGRRGRSSRHGDLARFRFRGITHRSNHGTPHTAAANERNSKRKTEMTTPRRSATKTAAHTSPKLGQKLKQYWSLDLS